MMTGIGWGMSLVGGIWMLGGLLVVAALVVLAVRGLSPSRPTGRVLSTSPVDVLRERYARGEINEAEFEQARKALGYA